MSGSTVKTPRRSIPPIHTKTEVIQTDPYGMDQRGTILYPFLSFSEPQPYNRWFSLQMLNLQRISVAFRCHIWLLEGISTLNISRVTWAKTDKDIHQSEVLATAKLATSGSDGTLQRGPGLSTVEPYKYYVSTILYYTILYCTILYYTMLYYAKLTTNKINSWINHNESSSWKIMEDFIWRSFKIFNLPCPTLSDRWCFNTSSYLGG